VIVEAGLICIFIELCILNEARVSSYIQDYFKDMEKSFKCVILENKDACVEGCSVLKRYDASNFLKTEDVNGQMSIHPQGPSVSQTVCPNHRRDPQRETQNLKLTREITVKCRSAIIAALH